MNIIDIRRLRLILKQIVGENPFIKGVLNEHNVCFSFVAGDCCRLLDRTIEFGIGMVYPLFFLCQKINDKFKIDDCYVQRDVDINISVNIDPACIYNSIGEITPAGNEIINKYNVLNHKLEVQENRKIFSLFVYALSFLLSHELGHLLYNHETENRICQEWRADNYAINVLYGDERFQPNVRLARPIGMLLSLSLPFIMDIDNDNEHPEHIDRMNNCLNKVVHDLSEDENETFREVVRYIQRHHEEIKNHLG